MSGEILLSMSCSECQINETFPLEWVREGYQNLFVGNRIAGLYSLVLTDCSNCFTAINGVNARCLDKSTRIEMAYVRDSKRFAAISLVCAPFNLSDIGTKMLGNIAIYYRFVSSGFF